MARFKVRAMHGAVLALFASGALLAGVAQAAPLSNALVSGVVNTWSDDDGEQLANTDGSVGVSPWSSVGSPTLTAGDFLVGAIGITSFPTAGISDLAVNQGTAIFATELAAAPIPIDDSLCFGGAFGTTSGACASFTFKAPSDFNAAVSSAFPGLFAALGITGFKDFGGTLLNTGGVTGLVFEGDISGRDFLRDNTADLNGNAIAAEPEDAMVAASNDTLRMIIGPGTDPGAFWTATGPVFIGDAVIAAIGSPTGVRQVGQFTAQQQIIAQNFPGWTLGPALTISNGAISGDVNSPWPITSNADFQFFGQRQIPEPSSLALLGLALAAAGFAQRRNVGRA